MVKRIGALRISVIVASLLYLTDYWLVTWWRDELPLPEIARGYFLGGTQVNRLLWDARVHTVLGVAFNIAVLLLLVVALLGAFRRPRDAAVEARTGLEAAGPSSADDVVPVD